MASISQRGNRYQAKVVIAPGRRKAASFDTEQEAEQWAKELEDSIAAGKPVPIATVEDTATVEDLVARYRRIDSSVDVAACLAEIDQSPIAATIISQLTKEQVLDWLPERCEISTVLENVIESARTDFGVVIPSNPAADAYSLPTTLRKRRLPTYEEKQLLESADKSRAGYLRDAITLALETSLKQAELVNLNFSQIVDKQILVSSRSGDRLIPLTDKALSVINHRLGVNSNNDTQVFSGLTEVALQRSFIRARDRANIEDLTFNDLHHEAIFRMKERYSLEQIWRISGVGIRSLARYYGDSEVE